MKKNIIIIEDDLEFAQMQRKFISSCKDYRCLGVYSNPLDFLESSESKDIDMILLDLLTPRIDGIAAISRILKKHPNASIIINSFNDNEDVILKAIQEGAMGYIDKQNFFTFFEMVADKVSDGGAFMTPRIAKKIFSFFQKEKNLLSKLTKREQSVAQSIIKGNSYKIISYELNISLDTVRMHIRNIYKKFQINSKAELINVFKGFDQNPIL